MGHEAPSCHNISTKGVDRSVTRVNSLRTILTTEAPECARCELEPYSSCSESEHDMISSMAHRVVSKDALMLRATEVDLVFVAKFDKVW